jgi:hypothetical protein
LQIDADRLAVDDIGLETVGLEAEGPITVDAGMPSSPTSARTW